MSKLYKVVTSINIVELEQWVNEALAEGWDLQGGIAVSTRAINPTQIDRPRFCQAMIKSVTDAVVGSTQEAAP